MTKRSIDIFNLLIKNEVKRKKGEISSKVGREYEDKVSFYILFRFNKLLKIKSKISKICFNGLEDLDIFDDTGRIFSFQIKKRKMTWTKRDPKLLDFLKNCINRFKSINKLKELIKIRFYFFTNITGNFLEEWNSLQKENLIKLKEILPAEIRELIKKNNFTEKEIEILFTRIYFYTGQKDSFLEPYIDDNLLNRFKKFKSSYNPGEIIDIAKFNEEIFYEKRLMNSRIYEPAYEKDILIPNILEINLLKNTLFYVNKKGGIINSKIQEYLKENQQRISYLFKYGKIYCFHDFNKSNPLTKFIEEGAQIETIDLNDLDEKDRVQLLNDWLYNYLNHLELRYYRKKNKRYFYFCSEGVDKYINWYDPRVRRIKEWRVVKKTKNFFENLGAEINFKTFEENFFIIIKPRLFFTMNGKILLNPNSIREIERTYRKLFMKNDFLRRRLCVFLSHIKGDIKEKKQQTQFVFSEKKGKSEEIIKKWKFHDDKLNFKDLIQLEANFKPNIEATKIPEDQKIFGD